MIRFVSAVPLEVFGSSCHEGLKINREALSPESYKDASPFFITALRQCLPGTVRSTASQKPFSGISTQCKVLSCCVLLLLKLKDVVFYSAALHIILTAPVFQVTISLFLTPNTSSAVDTPSDLPRSHSSTLLFCFFGSFTEI